MTLGSDTALPDGTPVEGVLGLVEEVQPGEVAGWAFVAGAPRPAVIQVLLQGRVIATGTADRVRSGGLDLPDFTRYAAFRIGLPAGLDAAASLEVRVQGGPALPFAATLQRWPATPDVAGESDAAHSLAPPSYAAQIDPLAGDAISGWARAADSDAPLVIDVLLHGQTIAAGIANQPHGNEGPCGFTIVLPEGIGMQHDFVVQVKDGPVLGATRRVPMAVAAAYPPRLSSARASGPQGDRARMVQIPDIDVAFRPSGLSLRGMGPMALLGLLLDGREIPATPRAVPGGIDVPLPPEARDSAAHVVEATLLLQGEQHRFRDTVQSRYVGHHDDVDGRLVGWLYDAAEPGREVWLEIEVDGEIHGQFSTTIPRPDVRAAGHPAARPGFEISLPPARSLNRPQLVVPRIAGTGYAPLGSFLCRITPGSYTTLPHAPPPGPQAMLRDRVVKPLLFGLARAPEEPGRRLPLGSVQFAGPGWSRGERPRVDVVIPVYRGLEETLDCVESVVRSLAGIAAEIIVIDDCSPEPELSAALRRMAGDGRITYLRNEKNLGFVATVNRGMRCNPRRDVVLLNSDTVVPPGWLDRLYRAAHSDTATATATALSNNATICSLPRIGGTEKLPYGATLEAIDLVCQTVNAGVVIDLPTAHGFCMFIKRVAIEDVGFFDEQAFTRGYAEENDFSLRAAARGWRNVAACDVFVQHKGSVSFLGDATTLKEKNLKLLTATYPDYHRQVMGFLREDPMHAARNRVQMAFWRGRRIVVLVTLSIGGGVDRHVADAAASIMEGDALVLVLTRGAARDGQAYRLHVWGDEETALLYPAVPDAAVSVVVDLIAIAPEFVHVHHVLDTELELPELIAASGLPYQVTLHDYFYVCPRVTLLDDSYRHCGLPEPSKCEKCLGRGGAHPRLDASFTALAAQPALWRANWARFLAQAARRIAPSADTAAHYRRAMPELDIEVWPHQAPSPAVLTPEPRRSAGRIKVLVLGAIGPHKGIDRLLDLLGHAERWADDVHFTILGHTSADEKVLRFNNVTMMGRYSVDTLPEQINAIEPQVALFLSPWPETFSYTLSEALSQGITPVAYDIGAIAERLRSLGGGVLRPLDAPAPVMLEAIREAAAQRLPRVDFSPTPAPLLPAGREAVALAPLVALRTGRGCFPDGWSERHVFWTLLLDRPAEQVVIDLWIPAELAGQFVTLLVDGNVMLRRQLLAGEITAVVLPGGLPRGLATLACAFDFDVQMPGVDQRRASAMVRQLTIRSAEHDFTWKPDH